MAYMLARFYNTTWLLCCMLSNWLIFTYLVRDLQSSRRNASVKSLLLAGNFLYNQ